MAHITIDQLEPYLTERLEQRAAQHGRTIEAEIKDILQSVLAPEAAPKLNLTAAIEKHFAHLGNFELPEIDRDPMRDARGTTFWEGLQKFRKTMEDESIIFNDDDFSDLRDRSVGREVNL